MLMIFTTHFWNKVKICPVDAGQSHMLVDGYNGSGQWAVCQEQVANHTILPQCFGDLNAMQSKSKMEQMITTGVCLLQANKEKCLQNVTCQNVFELMYLSKTVVGKKSSSRLLQLI